MPTYRNLSLSLTSQFDILTIPEFAPPASVSSHQSPPPASSSSTTPSQTANSSPLALNLRHHNGHGRRNKSPHNDNDPFTTTSPSDKLTGFNVLHQTHHQPIQLVNPKRSLVSVYIPTYPSSRFWLSYTIHPPHPPGLFYYFKLFLNGDSIVSWGVGAEEDYRGKTMMALFHSSPSSHSSIYHGGSCNLSPEKCQGSPGIPGVRGDVGKWKEKGKEKRDGGEAWRENDEMESRVFCFGPPGGGFREPAQQGQGVEGMLPEHLRDLLEVRVYRSKGRQRMVPEVEDFKGQGLVLGGGSVVSRRLGVEPQEADDGVRLVNAGLVHKGHPRRYYRYALLDPLDQPYATFHYYCRSWETLEKLGVVPDSSDVESSSVKETVSERMTESLKEDSDDEIAAALSADGLIPSIDFGEKEDQVAADEQPRKLPIDSSPISRKDAVSPEPSSSRPSLQLRPPTPPPSSSAPQKIIFIPTATALVPSNLLPTVMPNVPELPLSLKQQASKESFAALIRSHLPSPNTESFQLRELPVSKAATTKSAPPAPVPPERTASLSGLRNAIGNKLAKQRRRASTSSSGSGSGKVSDTRTGSTKDSTENDAEKSERSDSELREVENDDRRARTVRWMGKGKENVDSVDDGEIPKRRPRQRSSSKKRKPRKLNLWEEV